MGARAYAAQETVPEIWPTRITTSGNHDVTVKFMMNHPDAHEKGSDISITDVGTGNFETIPGINRSVEQKVYLVGDYANQYIGNPATDETVSSLNSAVSNVVYDRWIQQKEGIFYDRFHTQTNSASYTSDIGWQQYIYENYPCHEESKRTRFLRELKARQAPMVIRNHRTNAPARAGDQGANFQNASPQEVLALHLLRKMVSKDAFRNYLRRGIVSVLGPSGLTYNIQRQNHLVEVYRKGKLLSTLCVYLKNKLMPPTDEVVAKMIIVECDEHDIWRRANIYWKGVPNGIRKTVNRDTFKEEHLIQLAAG